MILTRSNAKKNKQHPELESLYRCICKAVPFDFITDSRPEYRMRLHVVRFQIAEGVYENIYTKAKKIADDRTYDLLSNNEDVDNVEIWDFVPLADFQPITLKGKIGLHFLKIF